MKREIRPTQSVSRPVLRAAMSANNVARFFIAQLFFGIFGFWFTPLPI